MEIEKVKKEGVALAACWSYCVVVVVVVEEEWC